MKFSAKATKSHSFGFCWNPVKTDIKVMLSIQISLKYALNALIWLN